MKPATNYRRFAALLFVGALLAAPILHAQEPDRAKRVGKRLMCLCGCNQVLVECNHVGCSMSDGMIKQLRQRVASNEPDDLILQSFIQEYGQRVLAEPPAEGFNLAAWLMPLFALILGTIILAVALKNMRRPAPAGGVPAAAGMSQDALDRLRLQADRESED
jgi:cytochrome c-type biogenesis protein CcmH